ncbi:MAG: ankyrin repeat domain-containing protein [Endozoicomonadaceae bacterium]|nr:ankyrin repeat domain-containing protein [Endozoicomonadaceae bacterium]
MNNKEKLQVVNRLNEALIENNFVAIENLISEYSDCVLPESEMMLACVQHDNVKAVKLLHNFGMSLGDDDARAVREAVKNGNLDIVKFHLENTHVLLYQKLLLIEAAKSGQSEIFKLLCDQVNYSSGVSALYHAAECNHLSMVKHFFSVHSVNGDCLHSALQQAVNKGNSEVVEYLKSKANIDFQSASWLMGAMSHNHPKWFKILQNNGISIQLHDFNVLTEGLKRKSISTLSVAIGLMTEQETNKFESLDVFSSLPIENRDLWPSLKLSFHLNVLGVETVCNEVPIHLLPENSI